MRNKLGLFGLDDKDKFLILDLLTWMHEKKADYTNTFCHLMNEKIEENNNYDDKDFQNWKKRWNERLKINNNSYEKYLKLMRANNPLVIPRNHKVEEVLKEADHSNLKPINQMVEILSKPYAKHQNILDYQVSPSLVEKYQTFCGT